MFISIEKKEKKLRTIKTHMESWDQANPNYKDPEAELAADLNRLFGEIDISDEEGLVDKIVHTALKYCMPQIFCNVYLFDGDKQKNYINTLTPFIGDDGKQKLGYKTTIMTRG